MEISTETLTVGDVMSRLLIVAPASLSVAGATDLAEEWQVRHLIVVEKNELAGVLCRCDLCDVDAKTPIATCMSKPVVTIGARSSLDDAVALMRETGVGCLPVTDEGEVVGIVTRSDLKGAGIGSGRFKLPFAPSVDEETGGGD
jgi:CBS domain-containing protein